jgi:hypothetical protein
MVLVPRELEEGAPREDLSGHLSKACVFPFDIDSPKKQNLRGIDPVTFQRRYNSAIQHSL